MLNGQRWVVQTCLRLTRAGEPVRLVDRVPSRGTLVYHAKHEREVLSQLNGHRDLVLVSIRADKRESRHADLEVVQNGRWADAGRRHHIPYWPQPGLMPRDPDRGSRVERVTFKGFDVNLHEYFFGREWRRWLLDNGFEWAHHSMGFEDSERDGVAVEWHDYRDIDAVVAFRPKPEGRLGRRGFTSKPATKLYNAWHAGVPAILAPEYAYRELRRSEIDYLEILAPEDARGALLRLRHEPDLYRSMAENGRLRATEFTHDAIVQSWSELLNITVPTLKRSRSFRALGKLPITWRGRLRNLLRHLARRPGK